MAIISIVKYFSVGSFMYDKFYVRFSNLWSDFMNDYVYTKI